MIMFYIIEQIVVFMYMLTGGVPLYIYSPFLLGVWLLFIAILMSLALAYFITSSSSTLIYFIKNLSVVVTIFIFMVGLGIPLYQNTDMTQCTDTDIQTNIGQYEDVTVTLQECKNRENINDDFGDMFLNRITYAGQE